MTQFGVVNQRSEARSQVRGDVWERRSALNRPPVAGRSRKPPKSPQGAIRLVHQPGVEWGDAGVRCLVALGSIDAGRHSPWVRAARRSHKWASISVSIRCGLRFFAIRHSYRRIAPSDTSKSAASVEI
jgi:hypothetical protein